MTVPLPPGRTVEELVQFVIRCALAHTNDVQTEEALVMTFGINPAEAALVRDRVYGGIVRAATGNATNQPDATKDPFAWASFERVNRERTIITAIYPQLVPPPRRRPWWQFWRQSCY